MCSPPLPSVAGRVTYPSPMWNVAPLSGILRVINPEFRTRCPDAEPSTSLQTLAPTRHYSQPFLVDCLCCGGTFLTQHCRAPFGAFGATVDDQRGLMLFGPHRGPSSDKAWYFYNEKWGFDFWTRTINVTACGVTDLRKPLLPF
ncbi:hypothetical protein NQZ68_011310 [Dissostichus eleginoides]|nr:hypothetical protein NQZ68_011310 [Dissostichus eleginoides]